SCTAVAKFSPCFLQLAKKLNQSSIDFSNICGSEIFAGSHFQKTFRHSGTFSGKSVHVDVLDVTQEVCHFNLCNPELNGIGSVQYFWAEHVGSFVNIYGANNE